MDKITEGKDFERKVAELYSLMGYKVELNKSLSSYNIDIYAEFMAGATLFRLAIECKLLDGVVRTVDVQKFASTVGLLKNHGLIDKAILISKGSFSDSSKRVANKYGIDCITYEELESSIIDFSNYIDWLIESFESSHLSEKFIEPYLIDSDGKKHLTNTFIDNWLNEPERNHLSILGYSGSGKTAICRMLAWKMANLYRNSPKENRIPIFIDLMKYTNVMNIRQLITDVLINEHGVHIANYNVFERLLRMGKLLIIFDGFDAIAQKGDYRTTVNNFWELSKVITPESKVILTCRTLYFKTKLEEKQILEGKDEEDYINLSDRLRFEVVHIADLENDQILQYFKKTFKQRWNEFYKIYQQTYNLKDIANRPIMLELIVKSLPFLIEDKTPSKARLYQVYFDAWLEREFWFDFSLFGQKERRLFMQELAWKMYSEGVQKIHHSGIKELILKIFELEDKNEIVNLDFLRTASFLIRDDEGYYGFAHKSFMEYFVAEKIANSSTNDIDESKLSREVQDFLVELREQIHKFESKVSKYE